MKIPPNTNDSQENSRPENCISPVLSGPPAKKRTKSKQNRDSSARPVENQTAKTAVSEPPAGDSVVGRDEFGHEDKRKGQFQKGQSGNPKGRPKGAFNRSTLAARAILERNSALLTEAAIKLAIAGSPIAIKLCLERLISIPSDSPITLKLPPDPKDPAETYASHNAVLRAVAEGKITPQEGRHLSAIVDARRRSWESAELADRMTDLESRLPKRKG